MSRARRNDNLSAVSMFPFLAVLLCTMGTLLVVLFGISRTARDAARREVSERPSAATSSQAAADPAKERELQRVTEHLKKVEEARANVSQLLRDGQARLSHIEDHIRRLEQQLIVTELAAEELGSKHEDELFDQKQAEREAQRLEQLIADTRATVQSLREEAKTKKRSYAVVPYKGPNGTRRRPLYIECRGSEVILQPEGLRLGPRDFLPPLGPGNPLAAALRAASEHLAKSASAEERASGGAYPLLLIRPDGIAISGYAREAIEKAGLEFGYQFVESDWELAYPPPSPELAQVEYHAARQAQVRQQVLMAAAPRVYGGLSNRDVFSEDEYVGVAGSASNSLGDFAAWQGFETSDAGSWDGTTDENGGEVGEAGGHGQSGTDKTESPHGVPHVKTSSILSKDSGASHEKSPASGSGNGAKEKSTGPMSARGPTGGMATVRSPGGGSAGAAGPEANFLTPGAVPADATGQNGFTASAMGEDAATFDDEDRAPNKPQRGHDWWYRNRRPAAVPIRRTIQVIVRQDRLAILPAGADVTAKHNGGKEIPLKQSTEASLDEFAGALREHVEVWGSAGEGLYWRPVLELNVGPDGADRAEDLRRLLKNSGVEVRQTVTAKHSPEEAPDATR